MRDRGIDSALQARYDAEDARRWRTASPGEHAAALVQLLRLVAALPESQRRKKGALDYPRLPWRSDDPSKR